MTPPEGAGTLDAPTPADANTGALQPTVLEPAPTVVAGADETARLRAVPDTERVRAQHGAGGIEPDAAEVSQETARSIGPYLIVERLAVGGMGEVFRAEGPGGAVAIKLLGAAQDDATRKRFDREGAVLAGLDHPCVVRLLDRGIDAAMGRAWLALELVHGRDLEALLQARPDKRLTTPEAALVLERCAKALVAAHQKGVIHRDVKPANLFLTPERRVLLGDFGIALSEDQSVRLTRDEIIGTPAYLAPEVVFGDPWTPAADAYALGVVGYRALSGRPPFEAADAAELLADRATKEPPKLASLRPDLPSTLVDLIDRLMHREPELRPKPVDVVGALAGLLPDPAALDDLWRDAAPPAAEQGPRPLAPGRSLHPGERFLHYRIDKELGRGAMGIVYEAWHQGLKKRVALKALLAGALASEKEQRRFLREAHAASVLSHPYVVPVLDAGEHDGVFYLTMDLVEGRPLSRWAEAMTTQGPSGHGPGQGPWTRGQDERARLELVMRLCEGVQHAHQRGVIHRDLKPDNILVTADGAPHILDFGVARRLDQDEAEQGDPSREGAVVGTLRYMAPEQAAGKVREVDVRSDVYALGTILYELLAGATPFSGTTREVMAQILFDEPAAPSVRRPGLAWELDAVCLKALEKERDDRYQSAAELRADLARFLGDEPILARQGSAGYRLRKWIVRHRARVVVGGAVGALLLLLSGGWAGQALADRRRREAAVIAGTAAAWAHLGRGELQAAVDKLSASRELLGPDDLIRLPDGVAGTMPAEVLLALDPAERERPRVTADRLRAWGEVARARRDGAQVERLLVDVRAALARGDLQSAAQSAVLAARIGPDTLGVRAVGDEVVRALVRDGRAALAAAGAERDELDRRGARLEVARRALEDAQRIDGTSPDVQQGLASVHEALGQLGEARQARALRARALEQAAAHVADGRRRLEQDDLDGARRAYEQALAFDGASEAAQGGLVEVAGRLEARRRDEETRAEALRAAEAERQRRERIAALRRDADAALVVARERFAKGEQPAAVREGYLQAMESLRKALFLAPDDPGATDALKVAARELSAVLIDQGEPELALFIIRVGGADPDDRTPVDLPLDPHVAVIEADRINIRRAFGGGSIHFPPSPAFDKLRAYVKAAQANKPDPERFQFVIEVRAAAEVHGGTTRVLVSGLRIQMRDTKAGTKTRAEDVRFEGGPYLRPVVVTPQGGRMVRPWSEAQQLDAPRYVKQVEGIVQRLLQGAGGRP